LPTHINQSTAPITRPPAPEAARGGFGTLPVLVYDHGRGSNNRQTAFALGDESLHTSVVPELADNYYHATPHGCVLLVAPGPSPRTRLWDPRSGEIIALPAMERELEDNWRCYLSDAPTAPSCVVVVLLVDEPSFLYCRVGGSCWSAHEYDVGDVVLKPVPRRKRIIHELAAVDGKLYFKETGNMGVIDFSPATPEFSYLEKHQRTEFVDGSNICKEHLVESRGELFYVRIFLKGFTREIMAVRIYQIDLSARAGGARRQSLPAELPNTQLLCSASRYGLKGNRVYFVHNAAGELDGICLYMYDMDDKSLKTLRRSPEELVGDPFWILPAHQGSTSE